MITIAWYLLKVIICSGILFGYYYIALRNKAFHRWNRFYLLATIVISLIVPVMKINVFSSGEQKGTVVQMLQTIIYGDEAVIEYSRNNSFQLTTENVVVTAYLLICAAFLFIFFLSLIKINKLKKKYPATHFDDISFINTNAKGTPFSFFKSIFWNNAIELNSKPGQQIFNHEIAHIKEKHSYDKVFMNIVLIFFWINPFFWLMRKELYMIHEFIADKDALEDSDINSFAEMVLQTVYPGQNFSVTNNFFYSPIKRRLLMLTKNKNPKVSYISRLLVLPLAAIVFFAFTLKVKNNNANLYNGKRITVVIDAGHGGEDNGAVSSDGVKEKDITLAIAKKIAELNSNPNLEILLPRKDDYPLSVKDRVEFAKSNGADMFISIHVNVAADKQLNGFSVLIDKNNSQQNLALGSALIDELKKSYKTGDQIGTRTKGVWILDNNVCPAALVECGYLSNPSDVAFISNSSDQDKVAKDILEAINIYANSKENSSKSKAVTENISVKDSMPGEVFTKVEVEASFPGGQSGWVKYISRAIRDSIDKFTKADYGTCVLRFIVNIDGSISDVVATTMKGTELAKVSINAIKNGPKWIPATQDGHTVACYRLQPVTLTNPGKKVHSTQSEKSTFNNTDNRRAAIFTKLEQMASFPGGQSSWLKYITHAIQKNASDLTADKSSQGVCKVRFIVNKDGSVSNVEAITKQDSKLADVAINAIENGPRWVLGIQNGRVVSSLVIQPVSFALNDKPDLINVPK